MKRLLIFLYSTCMLFLLSGCQSKEITTNTNVASTCAPNSMIKNEPIPLNINDSTLYVYYNYGQHSSSPTTYFYDSNHNIVKSFNNVGLNLMSGFIDISTPINIEISNYSNPQGELEHNYLTGFYDFKENKWVIKPKYKEVYYYTNHYFCKKENTVDILNEKAQVLLEDMPENIFGYEIYNNYIFYKNYDDQKIDVYNFQGQKIKSFYGYTYISPFKNHFILLSYDDYITDIILNNNLEENQDNYSFISEIPEIYQDGFCKISILNDEIIQVKQNDYYILLNSDFKILKVFKISENPFLYVSDIGDNIFLSDEGTGIMDIMNSNGEIVYSADISTSQIVNDIIFNKKSNFVEVSNFIDRNHISLSFDTHKYPEFYCDSYNYDFYTISYYSKDDTYLSNVYYKGKLIAEGQIVSLLSYDDKMLISYFTKEDPYNMPIKNEVYDNNGNLLYTSKYVERILSIKYSYLMIERGNYIYITDLKGQVMNKFLNPELEED